MPKEISHDFVNWNLSWQPVHRPNILENYNVGAVRPHTPGLVGDPSMYSGDCLIAVRGKVDKDL